MYNDQVQSSHENDDQFRQSIFTHQGNEERNTF